MAPDAEPSRAPRASSALTLEEISSEFASKLKTEFALDSLSPYSVVVEGQTDKKYLYRAVQLQLEFDGANLLAVPPIDSGDEILICTPGSSENPNRGGTPQMVRLARMLQPYIFTLDMFNGLLFVFDHDQAGLEAQNEITKYGFRKDDHSITLDPRIHQKACGAKQVVVEDFLSLRIQEAYFDSTECTCSVEYVTGKRTRIRWEQDSKNGLCEFVLATAQRDDLIELINLLRRIRSAFGFPA